VVAVELDIDAQEENYGFVLHGWWLADKEDTDLSMLLERLLERWPELLNSVELKQNPHDVQAWHDRVKIFHADLARQAATYTEAIRTVDPMKKATGGRTRSGSRSPRCMRVAACSTAPERSSSAPRAGKF
jgi:pre-mRNA-splicing factor SYF1